MHLLKGSAGCSCATAPAPGFNCVVFCVQLNEDEAEHAGLHTDWEHGGDCATDDMAGSADGALGGFASLGSRSGRDRGAGGFGEGTGFGGGAGLGAGAAAEPEHASGAGGTGGPGGGAAGGGVGGSYRQHAAMQDKKRELEQLIKERSTRIELVHSARDRCVPFVHL